MQESSASPIAASRAGFYGRSSAPGSEADFLRETGGIAAHVREDGVSSYGRDRLQSAQELGSYRAQFARDPALDAVVGPELSGDAHRPYQQFTAEHDAIHADPNAGTVFLQKSDAVGNINGGTVIHDAALANEVAARIASVAQDGERPLTAQDHEAMVALAQNVERDLARGAYRGKTEPFEIPREAQLGTARTINLDEAPTHPAPPAGLPPEMATAALNIGSLLRGTMSREDFQMEDIGVQGGKERSNQAGIAQ